MNAPAVTRCSDRLKAGAMNSFKPSSTSCQSETLPAQSETDMIHPSPPLPRLKQKKTTYPTVVLGSVAILDCDRRRTLIQASQMEG